MIKNISYMQIYLRQVMLVTLVMEIFPDLLYHLLTYQTTLRLLETMHFQDVMIYLILILVMELKRLEKVPSKIVVIL